MDRRNFFKTLAFAALTPLLARLLTRTSHAATPTTLLSEKDATAMALSFTHDATKALVKKRIDKLGVKGSEQFCNNCTFYKAASPLNGQEVGQCTVLVAGLVSAKGWCAGWTKK